MAFSYYKTVTIDHTKVPNTDQTNFPVLVSVTDAALKTVGNGGHVQNSSGFDIVFYSDSGLTTKLDHEVERYVASTGEVIFWVRIPTASHTTDTVFYMAYGDSGISTSQENVTGVWNTNYKGVWHLKDGSTLSLVESTATGANGTNNNSATAAAGKIGGGVSLASASSQYISTSESTAFNTGVITLEAWIKTSMTAYGGIIDRDDFGSGRAFQFRVNPSGKVEFIPFISGTPITTIVSSTSVNDNTLRHIAATYDGSNVKLFINGSQDFTAAQTGNIDSVTRALHIGHVVGGGAYFDGILDEVRVSNTARSADWLATQYNNHNSPSTFLSFGSESAAGATTIFLSGTPAGISTVAGPLVVKKRLSGGPAGVGTTAGTTRVTKQLSGTSAGLAAPSGLLSIKKLLSGIVAGTGATSGASVITKRLSGTSAGQSSTSGLLNIIKQLAGTASGQASVSSVLRIAKLLAGVVAGSGVTAGVFHILQFYSFRPQTRTAFFIPVDHQSVAVSDVVNIKQACLVTLEHEVAGI
jgi:hypothetical protein